MELNNTNKEVVVVEGYHDLAKLKSIYPNMDIVITNGSEISKEKLNELKILNEKRGLILFLDPDYQGERIRRIINDHVGETKHAFMEKSKCINKSKTKVGIEHAKSSDIVDALNNILVVKNESINPLTYKDIYELELIGCDDAKANRSKVSLYTGIGLSNGKTLLKKLNMFGIEYEDLKAIIRKWFYEENRNNFKY